MRGFKAGLMALAFAAACAPAMRRTPAGPLTNAELAELWVDPGATLRDLATGPAAGIPRPDRDAPYEILSRETGGFSITYVVRDRSGRKWHVKIGPEAQTEVVTSRIVWALGYHELPSYFVERWIGVEHQRGEMFGGARFRPDDDGLKNRGVWEWQRNPFVGARPFNGLIVLMMVLNSTDLKNENNGVYDVVGSPREGAARWYVVKDLGASLGETGRFDPRRGYIDGFEREPFTIGVSDGFVRFAFRGRHQELLQRIRELDVRWMSGRVLQITDKQLRDAFRAGGYDAAVTNRFVARIKEKAREGLALR